MSSNRLIITPASPTRTLSATQKRFNSLLKKIDRQRQTLQAWDEGERLFAEVWASEVLPLKQDYYEKLRELVTVLDTAHDRLKLSSIERETLRGELADILAALINDGGCDEQERQRFISLHDKYSETDVADQEAEEIFALKEGVKERFGIDIDDMDVDLNDPFSIVNEVIRRAEARDAEQDVNGPEGDPFQHDGKAGRHTDHEAGCWTTGDLFSDEDVPRARPKRETAAQRKRREAAEAAEQQTTQSMQVIFRRLASTLHPDREPDPAERERKTALMQRVTLAYREGRLLDLLELQLEAEQVDMHKVQGLADKQLKLYNQVLKRQSEQLDDEIIEVEIAFLERFGLDFPFDVKPKDLSWIMKDLVSATRLDNHRLGEQVDELKDGRKLRSWLKRMRKAREQARLEEARYHEEVVEFFFDLDDD